MNETGETARDVCAEMNECKANYGTGGCSDCKGFSCSDVRKFAERILAAHEREMAAKDAEIAQLVTKCNRLIAALKPVMEVHLNDGGTTPLSDSICAVREAQRIVGAWDDKNYFDKECRND